MEHNNKEGTMATRTTTPDNKRLSKQERLEAIRARIAATNTGSQQGWFNPKAGKNRIRIMPEVGTMDLGCFYQEVGVHYMSASSSKAERVYCPSFTTNGVESCPICEAVEVLYRGTKSSKKLAGDLRVSKTYWMNVIDRDDESKGPLIYRAGVMVMRSIIAIINDPDYGDITDLYDGLDITITKTGSGLETEYQVMPVRAGSPLAGTLSKPDEDTIDNWMGTARDLRYALLSDDPDEDEELKEGHIVYVLPYTRIADEYGDLDYIMDSYYEQEEEDEEPTPNPIPTRKGKPMAVKKTVEVVEEYDEDDAPNAPAPARRSAPARRVTPRR